MSSSEILSLLKRVGIHLEIGVLKALLKELGFNWNGKACSMMSFFVKIAEFLSGNSQEKGVASAVQTPHYGNVLENINSKAKP